MSAAPPNPPTLQRKTRNLHSVRDLAVTGLVSAADAPLLEEVARRFSVALPADLAARLRDPAAPEGLRRQFLPDAQELHETPEELADPIGDGAHSPLPGLVHRYPDRVLLMPVRVCPVYCRFCFRREAVGAGQAGPDEAALTAALDYIRRHEAVWEVILSGGDPLVLSAARLRRLVGALNGIPHVRTLRVHTRVPLLDPARVTPALVAALAQETPLWVAVHANHPAEFSAEGAEALRRLSGAGLPLLGQTVLLRGVNDDADTLEALFRQMVAHRIKPYYLHHTDLARGTGHFRVPLETGQALMRTLRGRLSGVAQPTYVLDLPGGHGKVPVGPVYATPDGAGGWRVEDPRGRGHAYGPPPPPERG